jgi:hypothetical protein
MKCPNCGNELSPGEIFCGQCGTPNILPAQPTEMVNTPQSRHGLLSGKYNIVISPPSATYKSGLLRPSNNQPTVSPPGPQQQGGFFQDSSESMSALPDNGQNYPTAYPQQSLAGIPMTGNPGAGQYASPMQLSRDANYTGTIYPPSQPLLPGQGYGMPPRFTPPPQKQRSNVVLIISCISLALAIIIFGTFGAFSLLRNNSSSKTHPTANQNASSTSVATPTLVPSPSPTPSPISSPSPTLTTTPAPDAGFTWCDTTCTSNGFSVEYPGTWLQKPTSDSTGTQFTNPSLSDEFAAFKTPGATTLTADQLVSSDLNGFFSRLGNITPTPTPSSNTTIGGENWVYQTAYYQLNGQTERIEVYATVHQGKAYIIELDASNAQFDAVNMQFFESMLGRFQFQQTPA